LPTLVTFRDVNNPKTVELVDRQDISKTLGPDIRLVRTTIEVTKEPITTGIEKKLPWLKTLEIAGTALSGERYPRREDTASRLDGGDFRRTK
jgi:hypothetical protein